MNRDPGHPTSTALSPAISWRLKHLHRYFAHVGSWTKTLGWRAYIAMSVAPLVGARSNQGLRSISLRGYPNPLYYRLDSSDAEVIHQVFAELQYECVGAYKDVRYIFDLGANIGCASFFLLHRYPEARAVVVEPDPGNMAMCRRNLAPFADRVTFVEAGIWSESAPMVVTRSGFRDSSEWAFQVRPVKPGEQPEFVARTVNDLLTEAKFPRLDIVKMDVEGAETEVFTSDTSWLLKARELAVELHGPQCEAALKAALSRLPHTTKQVGELTLCSLSN